MKRTTMFALQLLSITLVIFISGCEKPDSSSELSTILDKYVKIWNTGNFENVEEILHPDFELRMTPKFEAEKGIDAFKEEVTRWRSAYPDFNIIVNETVFGNDKAAARWTITATNTGEGWHPPTGKQVKVSGLSIFHFENGKLMDEWIAGNNSYWLEQLGFKMVPPWTQKE